MPIARITPVAGQPAAPLVISRPASHQAKAGCREQGHRLAFANPRSHPGIVPIAKSGRWQARSGTSR
jgi:hypothetical protein